MKSTNELALPDTTPTFTFLNKKTGLLETINSITGERIAIQKTPDPLAIKAGKAVLARVDGRDILVEPGVSLDKLGAPQSRHQWVYSTMMGEIISQRLAEGETLTKICSEEGMPPIHVINRWRHENSSFKEMVNLGFKARAEYHRDRAIDVATAHEHDEEVAGAKLLVDTHKWAASTDYSDRFGNKTKVEGEIRAVVKFVVDTGIRRPDDPGYNKDQTKLVQDIQRQKDIVTEKEAEELLAPIPETSS